MQATKKILFLSAIFIAQEHFFETSGCSATIFTNQTNNHTRNAKFWNFGIGFVRFENGVCTGADALDGTCYTKRQCKNIGGLNTGKCARVGACCVVQLSCGKASPYNNTYFVNPNFPGTFSGGGSTCRMIVQKMQPDICQIRLDFLSLTLAQPNGDGRCANDALTITGSATRLAPICGENSGQHVYLDFKRDEDIRINIDTTSATPMSRSWKLKVAQIGCDSPSRAPMGCLMYHTALSGTVQTFNYGTTESGEMNAAAKTGSRHLINQNYGVCIAPAPGYCSIEWQSSQPNSFTLSHDGTAVAASVLGAMCTTDFIVIPNPQMPNALTAVSDRLCGTSFPTTTTFSKPFVLTVVTDADEKNDVANKGFSLDYSQKRCPTLI